MKHYESVTRPPIPPKGRLWRRDTFAQQVRDTVDSGLALKIPVDDPEAHTVVGGLGTHLRRQGFRVHRVREGQFYLVWAEPIEATSHD